jgi:hypothetical protein
LEELVQQVGRALGEARGLFGHDPAPGAWCSTGAISDARDTVVRAGGAAAHEWQGQGGPRYVSDTTNHVSAMASVISADSGTGAGFDAGAGATRRGERARLSRSAVRTCTRFAVPQRPRLPR